MGVNLINLATAIEPDTSVEFTSTVIIAGLGTVLAALAVLIVIFYLFGKGVSSAQKRAEKKARPAEKIEIPDISEMLVEETLPPVENGVSPEVVAAISAAVVMYEGKDVKITSVKRKTDLPRTRKAWAQAAVINNTRPF